ESANEAPSHICSLEIHQALVGSPGYLDKLRPSWMLLDLWYQTESSRLLEGGFAETCAWEYRSFQCLDPEEGNKDLRTAHLSTVCQLNTKDLADITKSYLNAHGSFWVAESGDQVVGIVGCLPVKDPPLGRKQLQLFRLSVSSQHRGQGIGKALVRTVLRFARDQGYSDVVLETSIVQYSAIALYQAMGFQKTDEYFISITTRGAYIHLLMGHQWGLELHGYPGFLEGHVLPMISNIPLGSGKVSRLTAPCGCEFETQKSPHGSLSHPPVPGEGPQTDLADITKSYPSELGSCFLVAETEDQHRGQGIGKALVRTVLQFAWDQGYSDVVLRTTVLMHDAVALYEGIGFQKTGKSFFNTVAKLLAVPSIHFRQNLVAVIEQFQKRDYEQVVDLFSRGVEEHTPTTFRHLLTLPRTLLLLLGAPLTIILVSGSWFLAVVCIFFLLLFLRFLAGKPWKNFVSQCLRTDMADITKSYLSVCGSGFWVAESGGQVVGTVAALPVKDPPLGRKQLQLLHLSVSSQHRGQGIAKALVRTVLQFARDQGYSDVVLGTTVLQQSAVTLYYSMGFQKRGESFMDTLMRLLDISLILFIYPLHSARECEP
ncbi:hypothetical protein STEG23_032040, partial [Scotinomys teguina]